MSDATMKPLQVGLIGFGAALAYGALNDSR